MSYFKSLKRIYSVVSRRSFHLKSAITMSNKCKIGVCQLTSTSDKENCLRICEDLIIKAKSNCAKVFFLSLLIFEKFLNFIRF